MPWSKNYVTDEEIINAAKEYDSMSKAAAAVKLKFSTFKRRAQKLNVYVTNQGGIGIKKNIPILTYQLDDILNGLVPHYGSARLRKRLINAGLKTNCCEQCGISKWLDKQITIELHHIDGDRTNNKLDNLQMLCPNCHSQIESFKIKRYYKDETKNTAKLVKMLNGSVLEQVDK